MLVDKPLMASQKTSNLASLPPCVTTALFRIKQQGKTAYGWVAADKDLAGTLRLGMTSTWALAK